MGFSIYHDSNHVSTSDNPPVSATLITPKLSWHFLQKLFLSVTFILYTYCYVLSRLFLFLRTFLSLAISSMLICRPFYLYTSHSWPGSRRGSGNPLGSYPFVPLPRSDPSPPPPEYPQSFHCINEHPLLSCHTYLLSAKLYLQRLWKMTRFTKLYCILMIDKPSNITYIDKRQHIHLLICFSVI